MVCQNVHHTKPQEWPSEGSRMIARIWYFFFASPGPQVGSKGMDLDTAEGRTDGVGQLGQIANLVKRRLSGVGMLFW